MKAKNKVAWLILILLLSPVSPAFSSEGVFVKKITGYVKVVIDGKKHKVKEKTSIPWGSVIIAEKKSYAVLSTPDGSELTVYPSSQLRLEPSLIENRPRVIIAFGIVFHRVAKFFSRMISFRTFTPSAVCGVRGTAYYVEAGLDGSTMIYVTEGEVEVRGHVLRKGEALETVWTDEGWKTRKVVLKAYRPGRWLRRHREVPPGVLKRLFPKGIPQLQGLEKRLKRALKKDKLEEGRAVDLAVAERRASILLARMDLLERREVKERIPSDARARLATLRKKLNKINFRLRRLPLRVRHQVEKEMRLMNIPPGLLQKFLSLSPEKRRELVKKLKKWRSLTPEQRRRVVKNFMRFHRLPPEKRRKIIENYRRFKKLPPEKRREILKLYEKWRRLPPEKRQEIRRKLRKLHREKHRRAR